jgi:hypothetical protein
MIILSTVDVPAEIERCYALGCSVYMTKPVEATRFIEALRQLGLCLSNYANTDRSPGCDATLNSIRSGHGSTLGGEAGMRSLVACSHEQR